MAYTFNQKRVPEFFIVYPPEHSSESLLIPNSFVSLCNRLMPKNAVLSNHVGSLWHVIVDYIDGKVFFLNGWKKFVKDNSIESGDLLIFRYNGQCGFGVKVFGQDACEKIENKANGTSYMNKVKLEDNEEEKQKEEAKENDNDGDDNMDSDYEEEKQKEEEPKENDNDEEDCDDHDSYDNDDSDHYLDYIGEQEEDSHMNKVELEKDEVEQEKDKETKENDNDHEDCDDHDSDDSDYEDYIGEQEKEEDSYMNKVKLKKGEVEKEHDEETKENDNEDEDCDDHDSDDSDYKDYILEQEEDSTKEEEAFKNSRARKQSVGNMGGSKKMTAVKVEPGSTRTNPINIEEEEEESTIGKSRARKQSCGNNGVFQQMPVHKIGRGYKRTNDVSLEEVDALKIILPQNPHFIAKLKAGSTRNLLIVPVTVLKLYQLKLQNLIFFRNKRGMHWPGEVINRRNNQIYIRGWNDFCRANHVSMDDMCICEFPQGSNQQVNVIEVHIDCNTGEGASRKQRVHNKNG